MSKASCPYSLRSRRSRSDPLLDSESLLHPSDYDLNSGDIPPSLSSPSVSVPVEASSVSVLVNSPPSIVVLDQRRRESNAMEQLLSVMESGKLPEFSGGSDEKQLPEDFIEEYELVTELRDWDDRKRLKVIRLCLKDNAKVWYQELPEPSIERLKLWCNPDTASAARAASAGAVARN